ncbi:hypothetical protein GCM10027168_11900 [Streptomyces capparidis]
MLRALVVCLVVPAGIVLLAGTARAGGIVQILNPAFGNGCGNHSSGATARASTTASPGTVGGNQAAVPLTGPSNHCGGAEIDLSSVPVVGSLLGGGGPSPAPDEQDEAT